MKKSRIAIVTVGHATYFKQFPTLKDELMKKATAFAALLPRERMEQIDGGYVSCVDEAFAAVRFLKTQDADLLFLVLSTYVPSAICAAFARNLDIPQILVGIQPLSHLDYQNTTTYLQLVNDDICAMPEAAGVYRRLGRKIPPCIVATADQTEFLRKELAQWIDAACAKAAFKYETIGYLGHTYEGMYDMHTDPTAFTRAFGAHVEMLEICELAKNANEVSQAQIQDKIAVMRETFRICEPSNDPLTDFVQDEDLARSARAACALERLVFAHHLRALAYFYRGEPHTPYEELAANLIVGNTLLTSAGIPLAGEADLKTAAAMLIVKELGGGGSFAEIHPFDTESNVVLIGHDGPHNLQIAQGKPILRKLKAYHGKPGSGIGVEFSLKNGPVTMLSISVDEAGGFRLIAAKGTSLPGEIPQTGNTNTRVAFDCPVTDFLSRWCEAGPTHHVALGCGDLLAKLQKFSVLTDLPLTIVNA